ncbi:aspartic peptidase domain-containing protein [Bisporella sp. PMI_857]|nr:aspartic peptidase domain-containing protein [Bisporella sp. PMI_857]
MRRNYVFSLPCALISLLAAAAVAADAAPVVFSASQNWDGIDGPWSTFSVRLGNPEQIVRVLPSTSGYNVIVNLPGACNETSDYNGCVTARAGVFDPSGSKTWQEQGLFGVGMQANLGYGNVNGDFGLDKVGLSVVVNPNLTFAGQVIGGIVDEAFYVGLFGLGTQPTNFTDLSQPHTSFFTSLHDSGVIPSYTWSYSAGAKYQLTGVLGTMIFGGYDSSKFTPNDLTIPMSPDVSRDLVVGLQSITASYSAGSKLLMPSGGIFTFVDSTLPFIWLPVDACEAFEKTFGLTWNATSELYLVNDTLHETLLAQNPTFTFRIGISTAGGQFVDLALPYAAFDLEAKSPFVEGNVTRYFPLKRAANATQYTLGRAFLQETYLIADYERGNFSLSQCVFEAGSKSVVTAIKSIADENAASQSSAAPSNTSSAEGSNKSKSAGISTGAIAGIAIAAVLALLIGGSLFWAKKKKRFFFKPKPHELEGNSSGSESNDPAAVMLADAEGERGGLSAYEMHSQKPAVEAHGSPLAEMQDIHPVAGFYANKAQGRHEMHDATPIGAELETDSSQVHEMFDSSVYQEIHSEHPTPVPSARRFSWMETPISATSHPASTGYTDSIPGPNDSRGPSPRPEFSSMRKG